MNPGDLAENEIQCPFCFEMITVFLDCSLPEQTYIEDCSVCCRPIEIRVTCDEEGNLCGIDAWRSTG